MPGWLAGAIALLDLVGVIALASLWLKAARDLRELLQLADEISAQESERREGDGNGL
jgi:HAMP domain-containing protein